MKTIIGVAAVVVLLGGCSRGELVLAQQQDEPSPLPPSTMEDINETLSAPERGQVPAAPGQPGYEDDIRDRERDRAREREEPGVVVIVPRAAEEGEPEREPFYYRPAEQGPESSPIYEAAREGGGPPALAEPEPGADVVCEARLEPVDLARRVDQLEELARSAVGAEYQAKLKRAAEKLQEARAEIRREARQLEQAIARAERIHNEAMEAATETERAKRARSGGPGAPGG